MARIEDFHEAACAWLEANGLSPNDVPMNGNDAEVDEVEKTITITLLTRHPDGVLKVDSQTRTPVMQRVTVPLRTEPFRVWASSSLFDPNRDRYLERDEYSVGPRP